MCFLILAPAKEDTEKILKGLEWSPEEHLRKQHRLERFQPHGDSAYLVRVDGHACRQANHRDAVETGSVGNRCRSQVVVGLRRVTDQDRIHLQKKEKK